MKTCPVCGVRMQDADKLCPACGADYMQAVIDDISGGTNADAELMLVNLEDGARHLDQATRPALGDTFRRMSVMFYAATLLFCLLAGVLTGANIFYLLGVVALVVLSLALFAHLRGRQPLSPGEVLIRASERVFAEDAPALRDRFAQQPAAIARIDALQQRYDEALALQQAAHKENRKKIVLVAGILLALCCAGVAVLTVRNQAARNAEAAYAMQPEWVKLQDRYLAQAGADEAADQNMRREVVKAMLSADQPAEAETFFFAHSQGKIGDVDCAMPIARYYKDKTAPEALASFASRVKLRYDSDTQKVKSFK